MHIDVKFDLSCVCVCVYISVDVLNSGKILFYFFIKTWKEHAAHFMFSFDRGRDTTLFNI